MLRRLVAVYVTVVLTAGPGLCCCMTAPAATPATGPAAPPAEHPRPCCGKDRPSDAAVGITGEPTPAPSPGKHPCPCKDAAGKPTPDQPSSSLTAQEFARLLTALQAAVVVLVTAPAAGPGPDSAGGPPPGHRLTSWRLLRAPHRLLC